MKWNESHSQLHEEIKNIQDLIDEVSDEIFIIETEMPQDSKLPAISRFAKRIERIKNLVDMTITKVDVIEYIVTNTNTPPEGPPISQEPNHLPKEAHELQITFLESGSASVSIDGLAPFQVSPMLGHLLQALAFDTGDTNALYPDDALVPFKTYDEIIMIVTRFGGGSRYTKAAVRTGVHRLRQIMAEESFPGLIQTNRRLRAYRFALRRKALPPRAA